MYSINRNTNIGGHVLLQTILISVAVLYIDDKIGFRRLVCAYCYTNNNNCSKYYYANTNPNKLQKIYKICNFSISYSTN